MKNLLLLLILLPVLFLFGCAGGDSGMSIGALKALTDSSVQISDSVASQTATASVAKEYMSYLKWRSYYEEQAKIHKESGITTVYKMEEVQPGVWVQVVESQSMRQPETLIKPPDHPSEHPVWRTVESVGNNLIDKGLILGGMYFLSNAWSDSVAGAGSTNTYNGDLINSQNTIGGNNAIEGDYIFSPSE